MYGGSSCFDRIDSEFILPIQGWNKIYFKPRILPIRIFWFLCSRPTSKFFIYDDKDTWSGKLNYSFIIDYFIYY